MKYNVLIFSHHLSDLGEAVRLFFNADTTNDCDAIVQVVAEKNYKVLVLDFINEDLFEICNCQQLLDSDPFKKLPVVVLTSRYTIEEKLKAFESGCDDFIDGKSNKDEVCARITRSIFHQIANDQLSSRLLEATNTATNAIADNSILGATIRFLVKVNDCNNLDELGQQFFSMVGHYKLSCSLQMRTTKETKNMEAHGMAKDLESQLMDHLKDSGRFVDFGKRTVINYDKVSLLIKNMPVDSPDKYGAVKDNIIWLVQGVNARIHALESNFKLKEEYRLLAKLSKDVRSVISALKIDYQKVMCDIVTEVENVADHIGHRVPHLALAEEDERFMDNITERLVVETNRIFNEGLRADELFETLEFTLAEALENMDLPLVPTSIHSQSDNGNGKSIELF